MTTIYYTSEFIREFILFRAYLPTRNDEERNTNSTHNREKSFQTHSFFCCSHISQEEGVNIGVNYTEVDGHGILPKKK